MYLSRQADSAADFTRLDRMRR